MKLGVLFLTLASAMMLSAQGNSNWTQADWDKYLHSKGGAVTAVAAPLSTTPINDAPISMPEPSAIIELALGVVALGFIALWLRRSGDPFKTTRFEGRRRDRSEQPGEQAVLPQELQHR
jgi:hypothetical protein